MIGSRWSAVWCCLLLGLALLPGCARDEPHYPALPAGSVVLAFGDSITHGTGAAAGQDFPSRLAGYTGWRVINAGRPGELARDAVHRIGAELERYGPALVIVELGGNDFLRQRPAPQVKEELAGILRAVRQGGAVPVLVAVPRLSLARAALGALADSPIYAELAEEEGVLLYAGGLSQILSEPDLLADRIHPNARGYEALARGLVDYLAGAGLVP